MTPEVSVLVVGYNDERLLEESLPVIRHVMLTSNYSFEIIGVDNGSKDGTLTLMKKYCDTVVRLEHNRFYVPAFNRGMSMCRGNLILVTCPDIKWTPGVVRLLDFAVGHKNYVVAPSYRNPDGSPQNIIHNRELSLSRVFFQMTPFGYFLDLHLARYGIHRVNCYEGMALAHPFQVEWTGAMFTIASDVWRRVGNADEAMPLSYHDADYSKRLLANGVRSIVIPDVIVYHQWRGTTSKDPRTSYRATQDFRAYVRKWWRLRQLLLWPLVFLGALFSIPTVALVQHRVADRSLRSLQIG